MSKPGKRRTANVSFAKRVSEESGYFLYEVREIINAITIVAYRELKSEGRASLQGLGTLYTRKEKPTVKILPDKNGGMYEVHVPEKTRVLFKISDALKEYIEPLYKEKNHYRKKKKCQK
jgi:nucleoid DNA-binding protein